MFGKVGDSREEEFEVRSLLQVRELSNKLEGCKRRSGVCFCS